MGMGETVIAAGIGCRRNISAAEVQAAIEAAFLRTGLANRHLDLIAVPIVKESEAGIREVAAARGLRLIFVSQEALEAAGAATLTRSAPSMAAMNVHSVAEAAALAAAGPNARLLAPRVAVGSVTCALAESESSP
jgi:cobalt-precorrin 5A hydrolase